MKKIQKKRDEIIVATKKGKVIKFHYDSLPDGCLIRTIKLDKGDEIISMILNKI